MAEVQITRICKVIRAPFLALAIIIAVPAVAKPVKNGAALDSYISARIAESNGDAALAAEFYANTLKLEPSNNFVAGKLYVKAVESGDLALTLKAIRTLESNGTIDAEMPLFLMGEAFSRKQWNDVRSASQQLETLKNFGFLTPFINAWIAANSGKDALANLEQTTSNTAAAYYMEEQTILLLLAMGREAEALSMIGDLVSRNEIRGAPVRILAARHFLAKKDKINALSVVSKRRTGPEARLAAAIEAGMTSGLAQKVNARSGLAFLLFRLSSDLGIERAGFMALANAQAAKQIKPDDDYGQLILAQAYKGVDQETLAREAYGKIAATSPYYLFGLVGRVSILVDNQDFALAENLLDTAIKTDPYSADLQLLLGQLRQKRGDKIGAVQPFIDAAALAEQNKLPQSARANYLLSLGGAQEQAGNWPDALRSLENASELAPDSATILNYLGYAQIERNENLIEAMEIIRKAYALQPDSGAIADSLGWAYYLTGKPEAAVEYLEKAIKAEPEDPTINEHLGDVYWAVGRKFEARYAWRSAKLFADTDVKGRLTDKIDYGIRDNPAP